jgi:hypothetical protein
MERKSYPEIQKEINYLYKYIQSYENIETIVELLKELKRVLYRKDLLNLISQKCLYKKV